MSFRTVKLAWAKRLLMAKYFVVLTDKGSAIGFEGVDPRSFEDVLGLAAQAAEMQLMHDQLGELIKDHSVAMEALNGVERAKNTNTSSEKTKETKAKARK